MGSFGFLAGLATLNGCAGSASAGVGGFWSGSAEACVGCVTACLSSFSTLGNWAALPTAALGDLVGVVLGSGPVVTGRLDVATSCCSALGSSLWTDPYMFTCHVSGG